MGHLPCGLTSPTRFSPLTFLPVAVTLPLCHSATHACIPGHECPPVRAGWPKVGAGGGGRAAGRQRWAQPAVSLQWAEALGVFQQAADWIGLESRKSLWGQFWSAHQRFFKYLCVAAKVSRLVGLAREELARDKVSQEPQRWPCGAAQALCPGLLESLVTASTPVPSCGWLSL